MKLALPAKEDVERYLDTLAITKPQRLPAYAEADLPPAADFAGCAVIVSDMNIIAFSDGTDWLPA